MDVWSDETEQVMREMGWFPGRRVDTTRWREHFTSVGLPPTEAAERFLGEYGGLVREHYGKAITCARTPFEFDPMLLVGEEDRCLEWGEEIGKSLFPIGDVGGGTPSWRSTRTRCSTSW